MGDLDIKDLAGAPTWLAIVILSLAVLTPVAGAFFPRLTDRHHRRKHHRHHDEDDEPDEPERAVDHVDTTAALLADALDDLQSQRDRAQADRDRVQQRYERLSRESSAKDVTIARLEAQIDVYRSQRRDQP